MEQDRRHDPPVREFRLEGAGLYVVGGLFLAALAGAFYLGRWVERRTASPLTTGGSEYRPVESASQQPDLDVASETTYFDTVSGAQKQAEPSREMPRDEPADDDLADTRLASPAAAKPAEAPPDSANEPAAVGPFYVQLFAGRDRASAEGLVRKLNDRGYRVRLDTEQSGDGALYKVRVGGYAAKADAQVLAERLRADGYSGAWVTRVD